MNKYKTMKVKLKYRCYVLKNMKSLLIQNQKARLCHNFKLTYVIKLKGIDLETMLLTYILSRI